MGVAPAQRTAVPAPRSGGLVDIDAAAGRIPMRIGGVPAPWEPAADDQADGAEGSLKALPSPCEAAHENEGLLEHHVTVGGAIGKHST